MENSLGDFSHEYLHGRTMFHPCGFCSGGVRQDVARNTKRTAPHRSTSSVVSSRSPIQVRICSIQSWQRPSLARHSSRCHFKSDILLLFQNLAQKINVNGCAKKKKHVQGAQYVLQHRASFWECSLLHRFRRSALRQRSTDCIDACCRCVADLLDCSAWRPALRVTLCTSSESLDVPGVLHWLRQSARGVERHASTCVGLKCACRRCGAVI